MEKGTNRFLVSHSTGKVRMSIHLGKIQNLLFDYGNTLVSDPFGPALELCSIQLIDIFKSEDIPIGKQELLLAWTEANNEFDRPNISHFFQETEILERAVQKLGISLSVTQVARILQTYRDSATKVLQVDERNHSVKRLLSALKSKDLILGVLSNEKGEYLELGLKIAGLFEELDFFLSSEEIGFEKPDPKFFKVAVSRLNLVPEHTLYVGDDPLRDIAPAKSAGMKTALLVRPNSESTPWRQYSYHNAVRPNIRIVSLADLLNLFG